MLRWIREWSVDFDRRQLTPSPETNCEALVFCSTKEGTSRLPMARVRAPKSSRASFPVHVCLSQDGRLPAASHAWWKRDDVIRFVFAPERSFERALRAAGDRAFVVAAGARKLDCRRVGERLARSGIGSVRVFDEKAVRRVRSAGFALTDEITGA